MTDTSVQPDPAPQDQQNLPTPTPEVPVTPAPPVDAVPTPPVAPVEKTWWQKRIDEITREKHDLARELSDLKGAAPAPVSEPTPTPAAAGMDDAEINRRAAILAEANTFTAKCNAVADKGKAEIKDWDNVTETFRSLGGLTPSLVEATLAAGEGDAHKLIADLAKDPNEAMKVLRMSPMQQAVEMVKRQTKIATPAAISNAPAPITPVGGGNALTSKSLDDPNLTTAEWIALRDAELAKKKVA